LEWQGGRRVREKEERENTREWEMRVWERRERGGRREREKEEREKEREKRENAESDNAVEGSEEYFDESEHVDGSLKRSVLQTARMGLVRRWMRFRE
jgi:hypothetical protein